MSASGKAHEEEVEYVTMVRLSWGCGDGSLSLPHPLEGKLCAHVNKLVRVEAGQIQQGSEVFPHHISTLRTF